MTLVNFCKIGDLASNTIFSKRVPGAGLVAVAQLEGEGGFIAFEPRCPHARGPLAEGRLKGNLLVCPWHFFPFDLRTGKVAGCDNSQMELKRYPLIVADDQILVDIPARG
jgi:nitrite reductase (NADH) small subunit